MVPRDAHTLTSETKSLAHKRWQTTEPSDDATHPPDDDDAGRQADS